MRTTRYALIIHNETDGWFIYQVCCCMLQAYTAAWKQKGKVYVTKIGPKWDRGDSWGREPVLSRVTSLVWRVK